MPRILVIGSVHVDIVAYVEPSTAGNLDKIGVLSYTVGGTAFNVAANLAYHNQSVALFSYLKKNSFSAEIIRKEVKRRNLNSGMIRDVPMSSESGFVAHLQEGKLVSAVSCIGIQDVSFDETYLKKAISNCDFIAIECNLASDQIQQVVTIARHLRKPISISGVSESKVIRIMGLHQPKDVPLFIFVVLNDLEAKKVLGDKLYEPTEICKIFSSENVIITLGRDGFRILGRDGTDKPFSASVTNVVSSLGAGDAMYAALCSHFSTNRKLDENTIIWDVKKYLVPVLGSREATPPAPETTGNLFGITPQYGYPLVALMCLITSISAVVVGLFNAPSRPTIFGAMLFGIPTLAGVAGSSIEQLLRKAGTDPFEYQDKDFSLATLVLGAAAGMVSGLLFIVPQMMSNEKFQLVATSVPDKMPILLPFCLIVGFASGLAADSLLKRIRALEPVRVDVPNHNPH